MKKWVGTAILFALIAIMIIGCGPTTTSQPSAPAKPPIRIGIVGTFSGSQAELGGYLKQGCGLATDEFNSKGGIDGRKVELIFKDDETSPEKALAGINAVIFQDKVDFIFAPHAAGCALATLPVINQNKIVSFVSSAATNAIDPIKFPYTFRCNVPIGMGTDVLIDWTVKQKNYKSLALIASNDAYGKSGEDDFVRALKRYNIEPIILERFTKGDVDMTAQLSRIKAKNPDAILCSSWGDSMGLVVKSVAKLDMLDIPFIGNSGAIMKLLQEVGGEYAKIVIAYYAKAFSHEPGKEPDPAAVAYYERLLAKFGRVESIQASTGDYDNMLCLAEGIKKAGTTDSEKVKAALESISGLKGMMIHNISFNANKHDACTPDEIGVVYAWRNTSMGIFPELIQ